MSAAPDNMASDSAATEPLGDVMSRVARKLQEEHGEVEATLRAITGSATRIVPNAEACGISYVTGPWKIEPRAWTSDLPKDVDSLQERLKQGRASTRSGSSWSSGSTTWQQTSGGRSSRKKPRPWVWAA
jgi:hypothetical protein